ncbi:unnamed protein product [Alopecurus aequalis]
MDGSHANAAAASAGGGEGTQRTLNPYVTGNSVIAMKYKDGVIMACDTGASYGSTLRYKSVERIKKVGKHSLIGGSGEFSDFQEILRYLDELTLSDHMWDDGNSLGPKEIHAYLTRVMYNRRNKFDPLWNSLVLGGVKKGPKGDEKYLGMVNMIGTHFEENHIATGFGNHMAVPILRGEWREDLTFEEAVKLLEKCLLVLLYRDRSSINKFQVRTFVLLSELTNSPVGRNLDRFHLTAAELFRMTDCQDHDRGIDHLPAVRPEDQLGLCCLREPVQGRRRDMVDLCMPWP